MGFDEVLVITDEVDENLMLSSRNLRNVRGDVGAQRQPGGAGALPQRCCSPRARWPSSRRCSNERAKKYTTDQLMNVVLAPVVSEKSTFVADKNRQYVFRVADDATKPRDQGRGRADVQDQGRRR